MAGVWDWLKGLFGGSSAPVDQPPTDTPASPVPTPPGPATGGWTVKPATPAPTGWVKKPAPVYDTPALLSLSPGDWRRQALKIEPWKTAWIGRVDVIPPQSDERTALIDRGLILRGSFSREELAAIHEVGDLWLLKNKQEFYLNHK